ncbi:hypothetical protein AC578_10201 [Pseudocercospora eumusae]|uniref:Uncharacterized protein n=1 Tax=Pseudocercospora eumusae TaxID=321146 RepID=A0A139HYY7_9PEZI|nr:hypothetical protein AC578_10201 [Pseudocercospora eumusae]
MGASQAQNSTVNEYSPTPLLKRRKKYSNIACLDARHPRFRWLARCRLRLHSEEQFEQIDDERDWSPNRASNRVLSSRLAIAVGRSVSTNVHTHSECRLLSTPTPDAPR